MLEIVPENENAMIYTVKLLPWSYETAPHQNLIGTLKNLRYSRDPSRSVCKWTSFEVEGEDGSFLPKKRAGGGGAERGQQGKELLYSFIAISLYSNFMLLLHFPFHTFFSCFPALVPWQVLFLKPFGPSPQLV